MVLRKVFLTAVLLSCTLAATAAHAQATRTWVSGVGDDANPCSRTAPCKTFAGAISKTAAGGEISVLDPGGYGAVTITKAITIDGGTGAGWGSILASGTNGVIINAGAADVVTLKNLSINGAGTGIIGVRILAASAVHIEDSSIFGFRAVSGTNPGRGISDERTAGGKLLVMNTTIRNNLQSGIVILPASGSTTIKATIDGSRLLNNGNAGIAASTGAHATVSNSVIAGNGSFGLYADQPAGTTLLNAESCVVTGNGVGVNSGGGTSVVRLSNVNVHDNGTGLQVSGGGTILSYGNNKISGNTGGNGPPSGNIAVQ